MRGCRFTFGSDSQCRRTQGSRGIAGQGNHRCWWVGRPSAVWDAKTGKKTHTFVAKAAVHGLGFVRDAKTVVVGTDGAGVEVWTTGDAGYVRTKEFGNAEMFYGLAVSPDGSELAISANTGWGYFYNTGSWEQNGVLFESSNFISGLAFAHGRKVARNGREFVQPLELGSGVEASQAAR